MREGGRSWSKVCSTSPSDTEAVCGVETVLEGLSKSLNPLKE